MSVALDERERAVFDYVKKCKGESGLIPYATMGFNLLNCTPPLPLKRVRELVELALGRKLAPIPACTNCGAYSAQHVFWHREQEAFVCDVCDYPQPRKKGPVA